ncbi:MAG TPA: metal-dependent hydrolase [Burkholderiales bacterium]|nr:metal-dependent hydrolase [Burkholderiales bacterium]
MDPVAHTLVGAALAETGLKRVSRYATATLLIGANLPDVDGIASFWGSDTALYLRRGWTHGVLGLLVLPLLLAGVMWLWNRWRGQSRSDPPAFHMKAVIALSFLSVWSHPVLDWLNTYGVRLLMPFDGRWFYGDTLFIVDPWVWLLAAAGVVLARSQSRLALAGWIVLAAAGTTLVMRADVHPWVEATWLAAVAALVALRWRLRSSASGVPTARAGLATLVLYICVAYGLARVAENAVANRFAAPLDVQASSLPGEPFSHRVVVVHEDRYRVVESNGEVWELPREQPDTIVKAALELDSIRGFANWTRYPYWRVQETPENWIVRFWDLRYHNPDEPSRRIGTAVVEIPKSRFPELAK